ncbi:uncharacterized protein LOC144327493 [Podarcis muralis]
MAPKRDSARPGSSSTAKRPIRGPSQALRSPAPSQPVGRVQSLVASMAGDPAALSRFAAQMDGFLQQCSSQPSTSAGPSRPVRVSSPSVSSYSEDGREELSAGRGVADSQLTQPHHLPAVHGRGRGSRFSSGRASGGRASSRPSSRRGWYRTPPVEAPAASGRSRVVSSSSAPGPSRPNDDSESSAEDSLPVPARKSSGGKRHRRRSSRRRAKRRKDDSSTSYTGTSSSSSDDETGKSLELYWGFGEAASGLPRWAWERRSNSHRARYGAVQECRDGVLLPDVKVSTNSARDVIPGSHLPSKLRTRILNGRYVDMFKLAPPSEDQEKGSFPKRRQGAATSDRTFELWLDCFQVFAGVVVAAYPRRALHLVVYQSIVRTAFTSAGEKAAIKYDENFRRRAARIPSARWDRKDLDVWTTYVAPRIEKKQPEQQKVRSGAPRPGRRLLCWDFNKGSCQRPGCKFAHMCERCNGLHPASSCYAGRRPFRGGKGGSQQAPKPPTPSAAAGTGK